MINVVFCFDDNLINQARVAVASLMEASAGSKVSYNVYCVCTGNAAGVEADMRRDIEKRSPGSVLKVLTVEDIYSEAHQVRGITTATYLRLLLPELLPEVDRIIYADVDVLFRDSLKEIWEQEMDGMLIAGVKSAVNLPDKWEWNSSRDYWHELDGLRGRYFNAGVTLLNLELMRKLSLKPVWDEMAKRQFYYQDQDILNMTCRDRVRFLHPRWNVLAYITVDEYGELSREDILEQSDIDEALRNPGIIHYAGDKPWNRYNINHGKDWWDFVCSDDQLAGLFDIKKAKKNKGMSIIARAIRKIKRLLGREEE